MGSTNTVKTLFENAIALERSTETLYRNIGALFTAHEDVFTFWMHFSDEENGHAIYLERILNGMNEEQLSSPASEMMMKRAQSCLKDTNEIKLENIHTLDDAYKLAIELENSETNTIFEFVITSFSTDELAKSHVFLSKQLQEHVAKLENEFPPRFKSRIARKEVLASH